MDLADPVEALQRFQNLNSKQLKMCIIDSQFLKSLDLEHCISTAHKGNMITGNEELNNDDDDEENHNKKQAFSGTGIFL